MTEWLNDKLIKKTYRYKFTQEFLKKTLGMKGNITGNGLWSGRSPNDDKAGVSPDTDIYFIETEEEQDSQ